MALQNDFESIRHQLLNHTPTFSLDIAVNELIHEKTHLQTLQTQNKLNVLATTLSVSSSDQRQQSGSRKHCPSNHRSNRLFCHYCKRHGHVIQTCYCCNKKGPPTTIASSSDTPQVSETIRDATRSSGSTTTLSTTHLENLLNRVVSRPDNASSSSALYVLSWVMDSAYNNHMTPSSFLFTKMYFAYPPLAIHTANGSIMLALSIGSISTSNISIFKVLHVPKLSYNLVFVGSLAQLGYHVIFYYSGCTPQDPQTREALGIGPRMERMFPMSTLHLPSVPPSPPVGVSAVTYVSPSFALWHFQLGNTSSYRIQQLVSQGTSRMDESNENFDISLTQFGHFSSMLNCLSHSGSREHTKLEPRSRLCCFLGYDETQKGYRCYNPTHRFHEPSNHSSPVSILDVPCILPTHFLDTRRPGSSSLELPLSSTAIPILALPADHTTDISLHCSSRVRSLPTHLHDFYYYIALITLHELHSYHEASTNSLWQDAMTEEFDALSNNYTWDLVDLSPEKSMTSCK
ncbi:uncharacterized protein LOC121253352 [Juglans microcarpa x Juglans regia]|uniref:uncharacterized protein LOC121253352 n=1 Tax=Juglans microcarpa x Juglans regia TaxID=2249226 RepID=UPI001B7DFFD5|nr:uncharacterized protein LOC121253352 [Juglans microcarpa x Juglans regia]